MPPWFRSAKTFRARVFWSIIPIVLLLLAALALVTAQQQRAFIQQEFLKRGGEMAASLAEMSELGVLAENEDYLRSAMGGFLSDADLAYVVIHGDSTRILARAGRQLDTAAPELALSEPERAELLERQRIVSRRLSPGGEALVEFVAPIVSEEADTPDALLLGKSTTRVVGFVRLGLSLRSVESHVTALLRIWGSFAALFLAVATLAVYAFASRITRPINRLTGQAKRIAAGYLDEHIPVESRDELGQLADAFNEMGSELAKSVREKERVLLELQLANRSLEERGVELEAQTTALQQSLEEVRAMSEVVRAVSSSLDPREVLDTVAAEAVHLSGADACGIFEFDPQRDRAHFVVVRNLGEAFIHAIEALPLEVKRSIVSRASESGRAFVVPDLAKALEPEIQTIAAAGGFRALLSVPIRRGDVFLAIVLFRKQPGEFDERTLEIVGTLAKQSKVAVENARLFEQLEEKGRLLEVANRHKSEFLANMSHELRTPLNAVIGFSEVLLEQVFGQLNEKQEEYLQDIFASGRHLLSLINDILDLSKIEAGRMELDVSEFDLPTAIGNAVLLIRERASRSGVRLSTDVDPRLGWITADERKIKQILINLLTNAVKFTGEGGEVTLRAVLGERAVEIAVIDTGIGIAEEDLPVIFEEFKQVRRDPGRKVEGTGLGLTLSRKMVELHGGRISVESSVGRGSRFSFTLPLRVQGVA